MDTFSAVLGQRVRALRKRGGKRQEELAAAARHYGLLWSRAMVAVLEIGRRRLSVGELFLLPVALIRLALGRPGKEAPASGALLVADLLPEREDRWVAITPRTRARVRGLRALLGADAEPITEADFDTPRRRQTRIAQAALKQSIHRWSTQTDALWRRIMGRPLTGADLPTFNEALEDADRAVEQQAARGLRVPALALALAARKRWSCSLTEQRDRRLAEELRGHPSARRLRGLRGHHTRALLVELRPLLRAVPRRRRKRPRAPMTRFARTR